MKYGYLWFPIFFENYDKLVKAGISEDRLAKLAIAQLNNFDERNYEFTDIIFNLKELYRETPPWYARDNYMSALFRLLTRGINANDIFNGIKEKLIDAVSEKTLCDCLNELELHGVKKEEISDWLKTSIKWRVRKGFKKRGDADSYAKLITSFFENPQRWEKYGVDARDYVDDWFETYPYVDRFSYVAILPCLSELPNGITLDDYLDHYSIEYINEKYYFMPESQLKGITGFTREAAERSWRNVGKIIDKIIYEDSFRGVDKDEVRRFKKMLVFKFHASWFKVRKIPS